MYSFCFDSLVGHKRDRLLGRHEHSSVATIKGIEYPPPSIFETRHLPAIPIFSANTHPRKISL